MNVNRACIVKTLSVFLFTAHGFALDQNPKQNKTGKLNPISPSRTLTELLKQPGEAGVVDGTGIHHPIAIGTNGISARALRSNNGQSDGLRR